VFSLIFVERSVLTPFCFSVIGLLQQIDVDWPDPIKIPLEWTIALNFDIDIDWPLIPPLGMIPPSFATLASSHVSLLSDWRVHFVIVVVFLPLVFSAVLLFMFKPAKTVVWFICFLASLAMLIAGIVAINMKAVTEANDVSINGGTFALLGGVGVAICLLVLLIVTLVRRYRQRKIDQDPEAQSRRKKFQQTVEGYREVASQKRTCNNHMFKIAFATACFVLAGVLGDCEFLRRVCVGVGVVVLTLCMVPVGGGYDSFSYAYSPLEEFGLVLARFFIVLGCLVILWFLLTLNRRAREKLDKFKDFLQRKFVRLLLFVAVGFYVPFVTTLLQPMLCRELRCEEGKQFVDEGTRVNTRAGIVARRQEPCVDCDWLGTCPPDLAVELCPDQV
jgi:hypothetical protein